MFSPDILSFVDDTLIDEYFQPGCDHIRNKFNWTKSLPTAAALIIAIVGLAPLTTAAFIAGHSASWIFFIPAGVMLLWILVNTLQIAYLIPAGFRSETGNSTRLTGEKDRKWTIILSTAVLPIVLTALTYPDADVKTMALAYLIGGIANICAGYFKACTDSSEQRFCDEKTFRGLIRGDRFFQREHARLSLPVDTGNGDGFDDTCEFSDETARKISDLATAYYKHRS